MSYINNSEVLSSFFKKLRKENNITIAMFANEMNKSVGFISNIENLKTTKLDTDFVFDIFNFYTKISEINKDKIQKFLENKLPINYTNEETKEKQFIAKFDMLYRKIRITDGYIDYIKTKLIEFNITPNNIMEELNSNRTIENQEKYKKNEIIFLNDSNTDCLIVFDLEENFLDKILNHELTKSNYIFLQGIIYSLQIVIGYDAELAEKKSVEILKENKIYSLHELRKINADEKIKINIPNNLNEETSQLPEDYIKYYNTLNKLIDFFNFLRDKDVEYTTSKLDTLFTNLFTPATTNITLAFMGLPLSDMSVLEFEKQKDVFNKCKEIINTSTKLTNSENTAKIERID